MSKPVNQSADPGRPAGPASAGAPERPADPARNPADPAQNPADPAQNPADPVRNDGDPRRRGPRRAVRRGTEREAVLGVSADERPAGWGEGADGAPSSNGTGHGSNDEQLRQDVPPHWG